MQFVLSKEHLHWWHFYAEIAGGRFIDHKEMGVGQLEVSVPLTPQHQVNPFIQRLQLLIRMEKSSIECTMNEDNVQTPRKKPSTSTNLTFPISV